MSIKRREFVKRGSIFVAAAGAAGPALSFLPADRYKSDAGLPRFLPFRKDEHAREVKEVVPGFLWWDAADFAAYGGWALDTQFIAFMGSSYLIAHGTSTPVQDAVTSVNITVSGKYKLWVRSKNWLPGHNPGTFKVSVAGTDSDVVFGEQTEPGWVWQAGGEFDLKTGVNKLVLKDQTGFFGRCSSIILTRNMKYNPPVKLDAFRQERARLIGQSSVVKDLGNYDVVVSGAGPAGCCAAIAAARMGAKTVLITDRPVLGGNSSDELGVPIEGASRMHPGKFMRETGIVEEVVRILRANNWWSTCSRSFQVLVDKEPNLTVLHDTRVIGVEKNGADIQSVQTINTLQGTAGRIRGRMFIDSTGDGWLGYYAGADFRLGRESFNEYLEPLAPQVADNYTMSGCVRGPQMWKSCVFYKTIQHSSPKPLARQSWFYTFDEEWRKTRGNFSKFGHSQKAGSWWLEHRGTVDDLWTPEEARDDLIRINFSYWNYVKNDWSGRNLAANYELDYVPFMNGKRETRRLMGDHVLSQNELQKPVVFPDAVAHTGWPLDLHALEGIFDVRGRYFGQVNDAGEPPAVPLGAQIPFRSLYSRNIPNLLMAGRCMSVTHIALGSVRVEGPCCVTGQVVGTAAALAIRYRITPRQLYSNRIKELQQTLLKNDVFIPGVREDDPDDLARTAAVSCSSFENEDTRPENVINGWARPLDGKSNMWRSNPQQSMPQWICLDFPAPVLCNTIQCTFDTELDKDLRLSGLLPKECVKDYRLECKVDGQWQTVAVETGNYMRQRRHRIPSIKAEAVRLTVLATNEDPSARLFEIRVYAI